MNQRPHEIGSLLSGVLAALISFVIVLGSFVLALSEGKAKVALVPTATTRTVTVPTQLPSPTNLPPGTPTLVPTATPTATPTAVYPTATSCPVPSGWISITIYPGDTLEGLASEYGVSPEVLAKNNCLTVNSLPYNSTLNVPPMPTLTSSPTSLPAPTFTPTVTPVPCGAPAGWVVYIVRPGDTLYSLGRELGVSVSQLQMANCLGSSTKIITGQSLWVPFLPVRTPVPTFTPVLPATPTSTSTFLPPTARPTSTATQPPAPTSPQPSATRTPTQTGLPSSTPTIVPTATNTLPLPTTTPTQAPTDTPTEVWTPTHTPAPINTATPTPTFIIIITSSITATLVAVP
jgi:LysM repeat protein